MTKKTTAAKKTTKKTKAKTAPKKTAAKKKADSREELFQKIRKNLLEQKAKLVAEADATRNDLPDNETYPDLGDQASAESDKNFMLRLRSRESKLIKKIDETIERIDKGEYGICEDCGEEIDARRLEARPVTTFCIECKTRQEEDEKLR